MIEGLKVTVSGKELSDLCGQQAERLDELAAALQKQLPQLDSLGVAGTSNRPGDDAREKIKRHLARYQELMFIRDHLDQSETYRLDEGDLQRIGIITYRY